MRRSCPCPVSAATARRPCPVRSCPCPPPRADLVLSCLRLPLRADLILVPLPKALSARPLQGALTILEEARKTQRNPTSGRTAPRNERTTGMAVRGDGPQRMPHWRAYRQKNRMNTAGTGMTAGDAAEAATRPMNASPSIPKREPHYLRPPGKPRP